MGDVVLTFTQLAFVSALMTAALEVIFRTRAYQYYLGRGPDGAGSRWFTHFEFRPWIAMIVGVFVAYSFSLTALIEGLGIDLKDLVDVSPIGEGVVDVDVVITGIVLGGGAKAIRDVVKRFAETRDNIRSTLT